MDSTTKALILLGIGIGMIFLGKYLTEEEKLEGIKIYSDHDQKIKQEEGGNQK